MGYQLCNKNAPLKLEPPPFLKFFNPKQAQIFYPCHTSVLELLNHSFNERQKHENTNVLQKLQKYYKSISFVNVSGLYSQKWCE